MLNSLKNRCIIMITTDAKTLRKKGNYSCRIYRKEIGMIREEFKRTYKEFLLSLCGFFIACAGGERSAAMYAGLLIFVLFTVKYLHTMLYKSVFISDEDRERALLPRSIVRGKTAVMFCYGAIVSVAAAVAAWNGSIVEVNYFIPDSRSLVVSLFCAIAFSGTSLLLSGQLLFVMILLCAGKNPEGAYGRAWLYFIPVRVMFLFLIESQLLTAANSVIDSAAVAFLSPVLFNVLVIIGLIWLSLRILKKQQERIAELG